MGTYLLVWIPIYLLYPKSIISRQHGFWLTLLKGYQVIYSVSVLKDTVIPTPGALYVGKVFPSVERMKPWTVPPFTLEWIKDQTFHTSLGRKRFRYNAAFLRGISNHLTISGWCRPTDLVPHSYRLLFHPCLLLVNINYETTLYERCCGYRVHISPLTA